MNIKLSDNNVSVIDEGIQNSLSGMRNALTNIRELKPRLLVDMPAAEEIRVVKEIAHQFHSYGFWLEQLEFWRGRSRFHQQLVKHL